MDEIVEKKEPHLALFRAREYLDGMSVPAIEDADGVVHKGRLMSFEEVLPLQDKLEKLQDKNVDPQAMREIVVDICTSIGIPPEAVLSLPPRVMVKAVVHFFKSMFGENSSNASSNKETPTSTSA